jgi:undecaprenyl-diphosphatase
MTILHSIIFGVVEGLTEYLPISSTAHLILVSKLLSLPQTDYMKVFEISIQLGAIAAVLVIYFKKFFNVSLLTKIATAFIPTGLVGLLLYPYLKEFFANTWILVFTLGIGGALIIIIEKYYVKKFAHHTPLETISFKNAVFLGLFQALAIIPGTSRSGATIVGGLLLGIKREVVTEFTFLLAVPTMVVATAYSLYKSRDILTSVDTYAPILVASLVSFIVALIIIKYFLAYIRKHSFVVFGWYRIVLAIVLAFVLF